MKKILTLIVFSQICVQVFSQMTFQNIIGNGEGNYPYIKQIKSGNYIVAGGTIDPSDGNTYASVKKIDNQGNVIWSKIYIGYFQATSIVEVNDTEYVFSGHGTSSGVYLIKIDSTGNPIWNKTYYGMEDYTYENPIYCQTTFDSGFIIGGETDHFTANELKPFLIKTDANGDTLWTKAYGDSSYDYLGAFDQTEDSGFVFTGWTANYGSGIYLTKINSQGNILWSKVYGGPQMDRGFTVHQTFDKGYIIGGYSNSFTSGDADACLIKTDSVGDFIWGNAYGGPGYDVANSVSQTNDSGYVFLGNTTSFVTGYWNMYLVRLNSKGDTLWTKCYGINQVSQYGSSVQQTNDFGFIVVGHTDAPQSGIYLIKTDAEGNAGCNLNYTNTVITPAALTPRIVFPTTFVMRVSIMNVNPTIINIDTIVSICNFNLVKEITDNNSIYIFPNPSSEFINLFLEDNLYNYKINIFNAIGELEYNNFLTKQKSNINISGLKEGVHIIEISNSDYVHRQKFIKQ